HLRGRIEERILRVEARAANQAICHPCASGIFIEIDQRAIRRRGSAIVACERNRTCIHPAAHAAGGELKNTCPSVCIAVVNSPLTVADNAADEGIDREKMSSLEPTILDQPFVAGVDPGSEAASRK